jgi:CheY-like chemotaxis protein
MPGEMTRFIKIPDGPGEVIMIVDDDPLVKTLVERVLTSEGYRVITASDGFEAIDIYKKFQSVVELVILDFKMPGMDGVALFNELQALNPRVPAALTSGFLDDEQLDSMLAKGLRGFIPKPLTQQKLLQKVRSLLDGLREDARTRPGKG